MASSNVVTPVIYNPDGALSSMSGAAVSESRSYNANGQVTQISKYPNGTTEDLCQRVTYVYDANPLTGSTTYMAGRLGGVAYAGANCQGNNGSSGPWVSGNNYNEAFAYTQAGQVTNKTFRLIQYSAASGSNTVYGTYADLQANYTYDSEGKMLMQSYPLGDSYTYTYDSLGRSITMTDTTEEIRTA